MDQTNGTRTPEMPYSRNTSSPDTEEKSKVPITTPAESGRITLSPVSHPGRGRNFWTIAAVLSD
jgi:hypothetical protein